jgi:hypothetical protein
MTIGQWVRRIYEEGESAWSKRTLTRWHLVESVIDDEPVTRCGRRLRKRDRTEFEVSDVMPLTRMIGQPQLCRQCQ